MGDTLKILYTLFLFLFFSLPIDRWDHWIRLNQSSVIVSTTSWKIAAIFSKTLIKFSLKFECWTNSMPFRHGFFPSSLFMQRSLHISMVAFVLATINERKLYPSAPLLCSIEAANHLLRSNHMLLWFRIFHWKSSRTLYGWWDYLKWLFKHFLVLRWSYHQSRGKKVTLWSAGIDTLLIIYFIHFPYVRSLWRYMLNIDSNIFRFGGVLTGRLTTFPSSFGWLCRSSYNFSA